MATSPSLTFDRASWVLVTTPDSVYTWTVGLQLIAGLADGEEAIVISEATYLAKYRQAISGDLSLYDGGMTQWAPDGHHAWITLTRGRGVRLVDSEYPDLLQGAHPVLIIVDDDVLSEAMMAALPPRDDRCMQVVIS